MFQECNYCKTEPTSHCKNMANGFGVKKNQFNIDF